MINDSNRNDARLAVIVLICLGLAVGPGLLLVNRPVFIWGIPLVYAWAIFWYLVLCSIAFIVRSKALQSDENSTEKDE